MKPREAARRIDVLHGSPMSTVSYLLRPMLIAPEKKEFLAADFANIEGRGLAWLAGGEKKLDAFRAFDAGEGPDIYKTAASAIYGISVADVTDTQRQVGKVSELACGFGGGVGAFQKMARGHNVKVSDEQAEAIKLRWRRDNPKIVKYWRALEKTAIKAVLDPGGTWSVGPRGRDVAFRIKGSFLWCRLLSGRVLCYPYPVVKLKETPWGEMKDQVHYKTVDGDTRKWIEVSTYGGKWAENITQAICRDLLAYVMKQIETTRYSDIVLHSHDELVVEVPKGSGSLSEFETLCAQKKSWADGLPVVAKGWRGRRYRK